MIYKVKEVPTPWAQAQNHDQIIVEGRKLLIAAGITEPMQILKALAHMIWASGWRQDTANYNTHKIKVGSWWDGPVYTDATWEEHNGVPYYDPKATWRSYSSFTEGIKGYLALLDRPHMKGAKEAFYNPAISIETFADELEAAHYWSAGKADEGAIFASMARRIINTLERYGVPLGIQNDSSQPQRPAMARAIQNPRTIAPAMGVGIGGGLAIKGLLWWVLKKKKR